MIGRLHRSMWVDSRPGWISLNQPEWYITVLAFRCGWANVWFGWVFIHWGVKVSTKWRKYKQTCFDVISYMKTSEHACLLVISCASSTFTPITSRYIITDKGLLRLASCLTCMITGQQISFTITSHSLLRHQEEVLWALTLLFVSPLTFPPVPGTVSV